MHPDPAFLATGNGVARVVRLRLLDNDCVTDVVDIDQIGLCVCAAGQASGDEKRQRRLRACFARSSTEGHADVP